MIGNLSIEIPDLAEPIKAWRCWNLDRPNEWPPLLRSPNSGVMWPPVDGWGSKVIRNPDRNFITATCQDVWGDPEVSCPCCPSPSPKGHGGSGCGIYGYKTIEDMAWDWPLRGLSRYGQSFTPVRVLRPPLVWGRVLLWGKVFEHDRGYRAEFGRVDSFVLVPGLGSLTRDQLSRSAAFYGVPFEVLYNVDARMLEDAATRRKRQDDSLLVKTISQMNGSMALFNEALRSMNQIMSSGMQSMVDAVERMANKSKEVEDG